MFPYYTCKGLIIFFLFPPPKLAENPLPSFSNTYIFFILVCPGFVPIVESAPQPAGQLSYLKAEVPH
jgi:hypothetical protein